jgi:alcohol dehydrogenase class IV
VKAGSAVFDPATGERLALFDPKTRAHAIFIHPVLIQSAPHDLIVSASLNTFAMAIEGLMSRTGDPIADALLMHAVRLIAQRLPSKALDEDLDARGDLMLAAVLCGQGTDYAAAGITTVLGHAIGARYHMENGIANAIVLAHVLRFNAEAAKVGLSKVAAALGLHSSDDVLPGIVDAVEALFAQLKIPRRFRDVGVTREALPDIASNAMGDWFLRGNPRPVRDASELQQLLEQSW